MYATSMEFQNAIYGATRIVRAKAALGGLSLTDDDCIQSVTITRPALADMLIVSALSAKVELTALDPSAQLSNIPDGSVLSVSLGVEKDESGVVEWVPFQPVTCDSVEYDPDSKTCTVSGFDDMTLLDAKTFAELEIVYPVTLRQIAEAAAAKVGLSLSPDPFFMEDQVYTEDDTPNLSGSETLRQVIAWAAEAALSNAIIGRDGAIQFISMIPTDAAATIDAKDYFEFESASQWGPVNTVVLGRLPQEDNVFREDSEAVAADGSKELRINDNPFLDGRREQVIDQYFVKVNGLKIIPYKLDWRGNPAVDPGDNIQTVDSRDDPVAVLFGNSTMEFDGGLRFSTSFEIKSLTETDKSKASSTGEVVRKTQLEVDKANQKIQGIVVDTENNQTQLSEILQTVSDITLTVSNQEITLDELGQTTTTLQSQLEQTSEDFTFRLTESTQQLQEGVNQNADDLEEYKNLIETYIRFSAEGITIGKNGSPFSAVLGTEKLSFLQDGTEVAYISNNKLYITNAEVLDRFTVGNPSSGYFDWIPRANGNLGMKWRAG